MSFSKNIRANEEVDIVLVLGPEEKSHQFFRQFKDYCDRNNLKYAILGDGKSPINLDDIQQLPKAKHVAIAGHGHINPSANRHEIALGGHPDKDSLDVIKKVQKQTGAKNIVLTSCFGGKVVDQLRESTQRELLEGTSFFVSSDNDEPTMIEDSLNIIDIYVKKIKSDRNVPLVDVVKDAITTAPLTMVFAHQPEDQDNGRPSPVETHTIRRTDRLLYRDARKLCEYQHNLFHDFINQLVLEGKAPSFAKELRSFYSNFSTYLQQLGTSTKAKLFDFTMTTQELEKYQNSSFVNYVSLNDAKVLKFLLANHINAPENLLFQAITQRNSDSIEVVRVLLNYLDANSFGKSSTKETPLSAALHDRKVEIVKILISAGADIYRADGYGDVPAEQMKRQMQIYKDVFPELVNEAHKLFKKAMKLSSSGEYQIPNALIKAHQNFKSICEKENNMDFFNGQAASPINKKVFYAFQDYLKCLNDPVLQNKMEHDHSHKTKHFKSTLVELREIDSASKADELLIVIDRIIQNKDWGSLTLLGSKPKSIIEIEEVLDAEMTSCQKLERIQKICSATHAHSNFDVFISKLRGRDDFTNELYDILADIVPTDENSISNVINRLNDLQPPLAMTL